MHLYKKNYVRHLVTAPPPRQYRVTVTQGTLPTAVKPERVAYIIEEVAYWRKCWTIHKWFVQNVQAGEDDCKEYVVDVKQLQALVDQCKKALGMMSAVEIAMGEGLLYSGNDENRQAVVNQLVRAERELTNQLMPMIAGLFFDTEDYDEEQLRMTLDMLEPVLAEPAGFAVSYHYKSSW